MLNLSQLFNQTASQATQAAAPVPAPQAPVQAYAQPQQPPPSAGGSTFSSMFPTVDFSKLSDNNYMSQYRVGGYGGYGGDSGQYVDDSYYQLQGADGKTYRIAPSTAGLGYSLTSSDPLDQHNRFQLDFDKSGNLTNSQNWKDKSWFDDNKGIIGVLGAAAGGYAAFGGAGGAAATGGGMLGDATAAGYGGLDAASAATMGGGASINGGAALGSSLGGGAAAAGGGLAAGAGGGGLTGNPIIDKALMSAGTSAISSGLQSAIGGGSGGSNLGGIVSGAYDYYKQNQAANNMLDYMKTQQAKIDSIYDPNGPLAKTMYDQMAAKDAAAGRNSQYGTRATDFLGKFGGDYAKYTAALAQGFAGNYQQAYNQQASAGTGLATGLGNAFGSGLNSVIQNMSSYTGPTGTSGAYSAGGNTYNNPSAYGGSTPYQTDTNDYYPTIY